MQSFGKKVVRPWRSLFAAHKELGSVLVEPIVVIGAVGSVTPPKPKRYPAHNKQHNRDYDQRRAKKLANDIRS